MLRVSYKNTDIMKGQYTMEKLKNNIIPEEALNEITGGIKPNISEKVKLIDASTVLLAGVGAVLATCLYLDNKYPIKQFPCKSKKTH